MNQLLKDMFNFSHEPVASFWVFATIFALLAFFIFKGIYCDPPYTGPRTCYEDQVVNSTDAGVTLRGNGCRSWLQNNNEFAVRIRKVGSEHTDWIKLFASEEKREMNIAFWTAFYIYDMNGVMIGYIGRVGELTEEE